MTFNKFRPKDMRLEIKPYMVGDDNVTRPEPCSTTGIISLYSTNNVSDNLPPDGSVKLKGN